MSYNREDQKWFFIRLFISQMAKMARAESSQARSREPLLLTSCDSSFPKPPARRWIRRAAAGTQTELHRACQSYKPRLSTVSQHCPPPKHFLFLCFFFGFLNLSVWNMLVFLFRSCFLLASVAISCAQGFVLFPHWRPFAEDDSLKISCQHPSC